MMDLLVFCSINLNFGSGHEHISAGSVPHAKTPSLILPVSFGFSSSLCAALLPLPFSNTSSSLSVGLPPSPPPSLPLSQHSVFSHTHSLCLSLILSLISILLSMSWRRIDCSQPGSCVLLVLCHHSSALANPLSICLEELKDALSPGTSWPPSHQKGPISENCTEQTRTLSGADR